MAAAGFSEHINKKSKEEAAMPLNWSDVKKKYKPGSVIPYIAGNKTFTVTKVTDDEIHVSTVANPGAVIKRKNLERFVELLEEGKLQKDVFTLTDDYRTLVDDNRPTSAVSIVKDLGFIKI